MKLPRLFHYNHALLSNALPPHYVRRRGELLGSRPKIQCHAIYHARRKPCATIGRCAPARYMRIIAGGSCGLVYEATFLYLPIPALAAEAERWRNTLRLTR